MVGRNWKDTEKESKMCYEEVRSKNSGLRSTGASQHTQWACLVGTEVNKDVDRIMGRGRLQDQVKDFVI